MAIVYAQNVIEIAVKQTYSGRPAVNVWHMFHDQELTGGDKESVVRDFANNWQDHVMGLQVNTVTLDSFDWRSLDPLDGTVGTLTPDPAKNTAGQDTAAGMPPNVAILVHKNTSSRPRGRRDGRCYIVGVSETAADNAGVVPQGGVDFWNDYLSDFYNGISDTGTVVGGWDGDSYPVVLETTPASRAPGTAQVTVNSRRVTSITADALLATQRERLR